VTKDGGKSWLKRHVAKDQNPKSRAINNDLEGIGFINERQGWVGGWGFQDLSAPVGGLENSYTEDGGETWIAQNHLPNPNIQEPRSDPRYRINRYRFVKNLAGEVTSGYCSGQQVFKLSIIGGKKGAFGARTQTMIAAKGRREPANSTQASLAPAAGAQSKTSTLAKQQASEPGQDWQLAQLSNHDGTVEISYTLPEDTENVFVGLWNKFAFHVRTLVSEKRQMQGRHTVTWDGTDDRGNPVGPGVFICRMCTAGDRGASRLIELQGAF